MKLLRLLIFFISIFAVLGAAVAVWFFFFMESDTLDIGELDRPADQRVLFIGNSYTAYNDLHTLTARLMEQTNPAWNDVLAGRHVPGGQTFADHVLTLEDNTANPPLRQALVTGSDTLRAWDVVVLQEQSQIPGFDARNSQTAASLRAAAQLQAYIQPNGAVTLLFMTWGRRDGDSMNPDIYPNYRAMQQRLWDGYDRLAAEMRQQNPNAQVYVAPAGLAFFVVYSDDEAAGRNPTASDAVFYSLYVDDGSHPSLAGSYLAAATITAAYTGQRVTDLSFVPNGLSAERARYLREVADRTVFGNLFPGRDYPWN